MRTPGEATHPDWSIRGAEAMDWNIRGRVFVVRQPPKTPSYVLHYSSFTPPSSGHKLYFVFPQQVLMPSSPKLEIFGNLQGTRRIFFGFLRQSVGNENPFIFVGDFPLNPQTYRTFILASAPA